MLEPLVKPCPYYERVRDYARGAISAAEQTGIESHLQHDENCRAHYRRETAGRFPEIPNYTILRQIDRGGFGVVYKAVHHAKERVEALKVLRDQAPLVASYFENEVHLIARLRHPHIATLFEAQLAQPPLYYTMEYVDGLRLNDYLRSRPCTVAQRVEIIRTVAEALRYAHEHGVIHRDIKPQNIVIDAQGQPHVVDFGIAKRLRPEAYGAADAEDWLEGPVGTRGYMAPEQAAGRPVDARADIFALGVLLFTCLTDEPARLARQPEARYRRLRAAQVPRPNDLERILARCLAHDAAQRYASCGALAQDLSAYLAGRVVLACSRPARLYQLRRQGALLLRERLPTVLAGVTVGAAALLSVAAWAGGARVLRGTPAEQTVLIAFTEQTLRAIESGQIGGDLPGLSATNPKSWRMLHGQLMQRLAPAGPRVVAFDYYFPDAWPEFDAHFVRGASGVGAPVFVGAKAFDREGAPVIAPAIAAAVRGTGTLYGTSTDEGVREYEVVLALARGFDPARPSLPLLAFAAARYPDAEPVLSLDPRRQQLSVSYRRDDPQPGSRWHAAADALPVYHVESVAYDGESRDMRGGDRVVHARVTARPLAYWKDRTVPYEAALLAGEAELRAWFAERIVLVGQLRAGLDEYTSPHGERVAGCHVHADTIDALLGQTQADRLSRPELVARMSGWCMAAVFLAVLLDRRFVTPARAGRFAGVLLATGLAATYFGATFVTHPPALELFLAAGALSAAGGLSFWALQARRRELMQSPAAVTPGAPATILASTLLVDAESTAA